MIYQFERVEQLNSEKPYQPRLEYDLIPKEIVNYMKAGYQFLD